MRVRSTRGGEELGFLEAVDRGLAPDGGLYMPVAWPTLDAPPEDLPLTLADTGAWAAGHLLEGILPEQELDALTRDALNFPLPLVPLGRDEGTEGEPDILELFHGPTLAFKDVGARFLARLWSAASALDGGRERQRTVLVATSGDTGGAVAQACLGLEGLRVVVLFPSGRVSEVQRRQFTTLGRNVLAVSVDGPFDRCQALAKEMLGDTGQVARLGLTSANSINIGRLIPQVFYYLHLARLRGWGRGQVDLRPVVVPSGNLGNVTAGVLARAAGAPLGEMVAACNRNDALVRYLEDGETVQVPVRPTMSTAMDVGAPSNLERLLHIFGSTPQAMAGGIHAVSVTEDEVEGTLRWAYEARNTVLDPHTAVGVAAALRGDAPAGRATVLATAHPAKFPGVIRGVLGVDPPQVPRLAHAFQREERVLSLAGGSRDLAELIETGFREREGEEA